jgi:LeuA allosteric (dimerisation) domain
VRILDAASNEATRELRKIRRSYEDPGWDSQKKSATKLQSLIAHQKQTGTAAKTRVLITSTDGRRDWGTVGVSENIVEASLKALTDSLEYALLRK